MTIRSIQVLTWGTLLAALLSAALLAGEDAALPDLNPQASDSQVAPGR